MAHVSPVHAPRIRQPTTMTRTMTLDRSDPARPLVFGYPLFDIDNSFRGRFEFEKTPGVYEAIVDFGKSSTWQHFYRDFQLRADGKKLTVAALLPPGASDTLVLSKLRSALQMELSQDLDSGLLGHNQLRVINVRLARKMVAVHEKEIASLSEAWPANISPSVHASPGGNSGGLSSANPFAQRPLTGILKKTDSFVTMSPGPSPGTILVETPHTLRRTRSSKSSPGLPSDDDLRGRFLSEDAAATGMDISTLANEASNDHRTGSLGNIGTTIPGAFPRRALSVDPQMDARGEVSLRPVVGSLVDPGFDTSIFGQQRAPSPQRASISPSPSISDTESLVQQLSAEVLDVPEQGMLANGGRNSIEYGGPGQTRWHKQGLSGATQVGAPSSASNTRLGKAGEQGDWEIMAELLQRARSMNLSKGALIALERLVDPQNSGLAQPVLAKIGRSPSPVGVLPANTTPTPSHDSLLSRAPLASTPSGVGQPQEAAHTINSDWSRHSGGLDLRSRGKAPPKLGLQSTIDAADRSMASVFVAPKTMEQWAATVPDHWILFEDE